MSQKSMKKVNLNLSTMRQREENEQSWWSFLRVGPTNIDSFILSILQATTSRWHLQQEALSSNRQVLWVAVGEPSTMSVFFFTIYHHRPIVHQQLAFCFEKELWVYLCSFTQLHRIGLVASGSPCSFYQVGCINMLEQNNRSSSRHIWLP